MHQVCLVGELSTSILICIWFFNSLFITRSYRFVKRVPCVLILCSHYLMGFIYLVRVHRLTPRTLSINFVVAVHPLA